MHSNINGVLLHGSDANRLEMRYMESVLLRKDLLITHAQYLRIDLFDDNSITIRYYLSTLYSGICSFHNLKDLAAFDYVRCTLNMLSSWTKFAVKSKFFIIVISTSAVTLDPHAARTLIAANVKRYTPG